MRSLTRNPDRRTVTVVQKRVDGRYDVKADHWPNTIAVPVVPSSAEVPAPVRVQMLFEDGDPQRPFIYWPNFPNPSQTLAAEEEVHYVRWLSEQADFKRTNSQLGVEVDYNNLIAASEPAGGHFDRTFQDYKARYTSDDVRIPEVPGSNSPRALFDYYGSEVETALGLTLDQSIESVLELSLCIPENGSLFYVHLEYEIYDEVEEDYTYRWLVFALEADPTSSAITVTWSLELTGIEEEPDPEIVVSGGRVVATWSNTVLLFHWDALTGGDEQEVDLSSIPAGDGGTLDIMAPCLGNRLVNTWACGDKFVSTYGIVPVCINLTSNSIVWSHTNTNHAFRVIGISDNTVACFFEERVYETITDKIAELGIWDLTLIDQPRVEVARGHSHKAGFCTLNLSTGSEVGRTYFSGTEPAGSFAPAVIDYEVEILTEAYQELTNPDTGTPGGWAYNDVSPLVFVGYGNFFDGALPDPPVGNSTGTYIEGPPEGPNNFGPFNSLTDLIAGGSEDPLDYSEPFAWQNQRKADQAAYRNVRAARSASPAQINSFEQLGADVETTHRAEAEDWVREEKIQTECDNLALWTGAFDPLVSPTTSQTITSEHFIPTERETEEPFNDNLSLLPINSRDSTAELIPTPTPAHGDPVLGGWSKEFRAWHESRTGPGDVNPWEGLVSHGFSGPVPSSGSTFTHRQKLLFRPVPLTLIDRERTVPPNIEAGPVPFSGSKWSIGPRFVSGEPLTWYVFLETGALSWSKMISKGNTDPGSSGWFDTPNGRALFTFYNESGQEKLIVLAEEDGTTLYDGTVPATGDMNNWIFIDGTFYSTASNAALTG